MNTRLKQFLAAENITQAQFADSINVVRASVSHILSGRNNPSFDFIKAMMSKYPNLNIEWLVFGKGKMYKDPVAPESDLIFPEENVEASPVISEIFPEVEHPETTAPINEFNSLDYTTQQIENQRKVTKIIILFDDGTYQEM